MPKGSRTLGAGAAARAARRLALPALAAGSIALTAALPSAAAASSAAGTASLAMPAAVNVSELSPEAIQELLASIQAGETGIPSSALDVSKLAELLAGLQGFDELPSVTGGGTAGLEAALRETLEKLLAGHTTLEELLGTLPSGEPLEDLNVGDLAAMLGKTPEALAQALGQTAASLPATAAVVTRTLENGDKLAAVDGAEGLVLALLAKGTEGVEGLGSENGGTTVGGHSTNGGPGGPGGAGGPPGATTVVLTMPAGASSAASGASRVGKLTIVGRKVHGASATLVVQVPSAGRLTLSGSGVKKVTREAAKAERVTITTALTKARAASLRKHHRKQTSVKLTAAFAPVAGAASRATTNVSLR